MTLRDSVAVKSIESKLLLTMEKSLESNEGSILGYTRTESNTMWDWLVRLSGDVVSALLLSYGAQFWFDYIRKIFTRWGKGGADSGQK